MPCMLLLRQYLKAMSVLGRTLLEHFRATTGRIMVQGLFESVDVSLSHETSFFTSMFKSTIFTILYCLKIVHLLAPIDS